MTEVNSISDLASRFINHTAKPIFLTGKAGTGKTTFLKKIIRNTHKRAVIVAPTGIAAINAGGVTIHSFFQLPFGSYIPVDGEALVNDSQVNTRTTLLRNIRLHENKRRIIRDLELLIIDEVSMLRADILDAIDAVCRMVRRNNKTFGGIQILFIGDLLQLPPVTRNNEWRILKDHYRSMFFFDSKALNECPPVYIELKTIYRQKDQEFVDVLNNLRNSKITNNDIELLNKYYKPGFEAPETEKYIYLTTHNSKADQLNSGKLARLSSKETAFEATINNDFPEYSYPAEKSLKLKVGAQVMFIKNDPTGQGRFFNGKIATVSKLGKDEVLVVTEEGVEISVSKYEWENIKFSLNESTRQIEEKVQGTFTQYPLKLAWAITVHKSQGLTFEKAIIDIGDAFAPGQVYVALSRLTSLNGLVLTSKLDPRSLQSDSNVAGFSSNEKSEEELAVALKEDSYSYLRSICLDAFSLTDIEVEFGKHLSQYSKETRSPRKKFLSWANDISEKMKSDVVAGDKFRNQLLRLFSEKDVAVLKDRIIAGSFYFSKNLKTYYESILEKIKLCSEEKNLKSFVEELEVLEELIFIKRKEIKKAEGLAVAFSDQKEYSGEDKSLTEERLHSKTSSKKIKVKAPKKAKGESGRATLEIYLRTRSVEETAKERNLAASTIEGHLSKFVTSGEIPVSDFISEKKLTDFLSAMNKDATQKLSDLKNVLENFSYSEIRMASAEFQRLKGF